LGLIVYFWHSTRTVFVIFPLSLMSHDILAEEQGTTDVRIPSYVRQGNDSEVVAEGSDVSEKQDTV